MDDTQTVTHTYRFGGQLHDRITRVLCFRIQIGSVLAISLTLLMSFILNGWFSVACGTVIYLIDRDEPLVGYLLESTDDTVVLRQRNVNGSFKRVTIKRSEIARLLNPIDEKRLSQLSLDQLAAYRDYAEELSAKAIDPEATELAIRLYLIVAHHGEEALQQQALRALIALARSPQEERELRMIAYQSDPSRNRFLLATPKTTRVNPGELTAESREALLRAIERLRQGERREAKRRIGNESARQALESFAATLTVSAFEQACEQETLSSEMLYTLLSIELALLNPSRGRLATSDGGTRSELSSATWGESVLRETAPVRIRGLMDVTEFDPRECYYDNGRWSVSPQRPPNASIK